MKIGEMVDLNSEDLDEWNHLRNIHIKNSYLYRLDMFLTEYKKNLHFTNKMKKSKNVDNQRKKLFKIDKKLFELQFFIPFIHLNSDYKTYIENKEFKLLKNGNIIVLEDEIKSAELEMIELAHNKLTEYLKVLLKDKRRINIRKHLILSNIDALSPKDHLAYSYLYRLNKSLFSIDPFDTEKIYFSLSNIPTIPGLIFKSTINHKVHKKRDNDNMENIEVFIDIDDILKASEIELKSAHKLLSEYLKKK